MTSPAASKAPLVSVVVPTFGRGQFVRTAVKAALLQEGVEVEVIVLADGPDAADHAQIEELGHPSVRVIATPVLDGVSPARNRGFDAASGAWVALLDDDDLWAPEKLRRQIEAAEAADVDFAYSSAAILEPDLTLKRIQFAPPASALSTAMVANNPIPATCSSLVVCTEVARAVRFDPDLMHLADWDFAIGLILASRGLDVSDVLVGYVHHPEGMHYRRLQSIEREFVRFRDKHRRRGLKIGSPVQSRWIAGNYREAGQRGRAAYAYMRGAARYRSLGDVVRAGGVLLGDRAMRIGAGKRRRTDPEPPPRWLALYGHTRSGPKVG